MADKHDQELLAIFSKIVELLGSTDRAVTHQTTWADLGMNSSAVEAFVRGKCATEFNIALDVDDAGSGPADLAVKIHNVLP
jgi:hypothetical protein